MMRLSPRRALALFVVAMLPPPALAVSISTPFATISGASLFWLNSGPGNTGTGGSLFTFTSLAHPLPANVPVAFSFMPPLADPDDDAYASAGPQFFYFNASVPSGNPATLSGSSLTQSNIAGSFAVFSNLNRHAVVIGQKVYAPGISLLAGTFTGGTITGQVGGSTATFDATVTFTSGFMGFGPTGNTIHIVKTGVTPTLSAATGKALRSFDPSATVTFSTTPAVPEPATWALLVIGFGAVGAARRRRVAATAG